MDKCPYTASELKQAYSYLYDEELVIDLSVTQVWDSFKETVRREIEDYFGRPSGVQ